MAVKQRREFGQVKEMRSGRFQALYTDPRDGSRESLGTFPTRKAANAALAEAQTKITANTWNDPKRGAVLFSEYAAEQVEERKLAPRTKDLYRDNLRLYLNPTFGQTPLNQIDVRAVDKWFAGMRKRDIPTATQNSYTTLRMVMSHAVRQGLISVSPCTLADVKKHKTTERPYMSFDDVVAIANEMQPHLRPVVLLTFGAALRLGEVVALQRKDLDLETGMLTVNKQVVMARGGSSVTPTKTGDTKKVKVNGPVLEVIRKYLEEYPKSSLQPLFTGSQGARLHRTHFTKKYREAQVKAGLTQFDFHDIRHAALTHFANNGATTKELMARGGHKTAVASLIYQQIAADHNSAVLDAADAALAGKL